CQDTPVDILMYYDARPETPYNGLFDFYTFRPLPSYYSFYAWSRLADLGRQVKVETQEEADIFAAAAAGSDGTVRTMLARYNDNDNLNRTKAVKVHIEGARDGQAVAHVVSAVKLYSETLLTVQDGTVTLTLEPNSFVMIETRQ
ncbi:MAG: hypothetical protein II600_03300, partial [Bacteroidaceae bacterium]|nr:hypothetical protein [Bacteroidaceae bacterium]